MEETKHSSTDELKDNTKYIPAVTLFVTIICISLFVGINVLEDEQTWEVYRRWGAPSFTDLFSGDYWGLLTTNFLHTEIWHIFFNLYWFWRFGKKIEYEEGWLFFLFLIITSGLASSFSQLGFGEETGIGLSGIGYALFGFIFIKSRTSDAYRNFLDDKTRNLFLIWFVACFVITYLDILNIGNAAHTGGLIWGIATAYLSGFKPVNKWSYGFALFGLIGTSFLWNPFATALLTYKAEKLHNSGEYDKAKVLYRQILERDADNQFTDFNLKNLEILPLKEKAYEHFTNSEYDKVREVCNQILELDANDMWVKEILNRLPNKEIESQLPANESSN